MVLARDIQQNIVLWDVEFFNLHLFTDATQAELKRARARIQSSELDVTPSLLSRFQDRGGGRCGPGAVGPEAVRGCG